MKEILIKGVIGQDFTLVDLLAQIRADKEETDFRFIVDSVGGYVDEGFRIAAVIESLNATTVARKVMSIANIIYFAGAKREAEPNAQFMLHNAWGEIAGNAQQLEYAAAQLRNEDAKMRNYISERTGLPDAQLVQLMSQDTYIDSKQAEAIGFYKQASARLRLCALYTNDSDMDLKSIMADIRAIKAQLLGAKAMQKLTLADGSEVEVDSEDGEFVGKSTNAPDGTHDLQDGRKLVVAGGIVTAVTEAEPTAEAQAMDDPEKLKEEMAAKDAEIVALKEANARALQTMAKELEAIKAMVKTNGQAHKRTATFAQEAPEDKAMANANRLATEALAKKNPNLGANEYTWRNSVFNK